MRSKAVCRSFAAGPDALTSRILRSGEAIVYLCAILDANAEKSSLGCATLQDKRSYETTLSAYVNRPCSMSSVFGGVVCAFSFLRPCEELKKENN